MKSFEHTPVMVEEVVRFLACCSGGCYIDATVGGGGHARAILEATAPDGRIFGIDRDPDAVSAAGGSLRLFGNRVKILRGEFSNLDSLIRGPDFKCANGILLDLGVSSYQLGEPSRGFGFGEEGPLDMRMDPANELSAAEVVGTFDEEELARIIFELGEERHSRKIAAAIVKRRRVRPVVTTADLSGIIVSAVPAHARKGRIHAATRTFQALRIFVNDELGQLRKFLDFAPKLLCGNGRLVIISYHSLEDRIVKNSFRLWGGRGGFKIVTKKVVTPTEEEKKKNARSRSAKLRVLERIDDGFQSCCC